MASRKRPEAGRTMCLEASDPTRAECGVTAWRQPGPARPGIGGLLPSPPHPGSPQVLKLGFALPSSRRAPPTRRASGGPAAGAREVGTPFSPASSPTRAKWAPRGGVRANGRPLEGTPAGSRARAMARPAGREDAPAARVHVLTPPLGMAGHGASSPWLPQPGPTAGAPHPGVPATPHAGSTHGSPAGCSRDHAPRHPKDSLPRPQTQSPPRAHSG